MLYLRDTPLMVKCHHCGTFLQLEGVKTPTGSERGYLFGGERIDVTCPNCLLVETIYPVVGTVRR